MNAWRTSAVSAILLIAFTATAFAKPAKKKIQRQQISKIECFTDEDRRGGWSVCGGSEVASTPRQSAARVVRATRRSVVAVASGGLGGYGLVAEARRHMGATAAQLGLKRRSLWCGEFIASIAPDAASKVRNPNMARDYLALPRTTLSVGAIAVLSRGRGGHVGVVSGIAPNGNPIIISGNHNRRVGEGEYPRSRVLAYVVPHA